MEYIKNNYGDVSSAISENLLLNGRLHWCSILKGTVDHLKNEIETQGEGLESPPCPFSCRIVLM